MERIQAIFDAYADRLEARLGAGFLDLNTGAQCYVNGDMPFPSASTYKVPLLIELFAQAYAGGVDLQRFYTLRAEDKSVGSGVLAHFTPGSTLTYENLATLMMIISDNTATDIIWRLLGLENINRRLEAMGLRHTKCDLTCDAMVRMTYGVPLDIDYAAANAALDAAVEVSPQLYVDMDGPNDISSPMDMVKMFEMIYRGQVVTPEACARMMAIMEACQTNSRIPYYLPQGGPNGARIAHKTGSLAYVVNDSGIIQTAHSAYVLSLFVNGYGASDAEKEKSGRDHLYEKMLASLSLEVFEAMQSG